MGLLLLLGDSGFRGALDTLGSGLESAWSVGRRLRTAYTGPIIRVRRSSDNVEQDFGGSGSLGAVNPSAVAAFCGAGDGFLTTIYDQSGLARNLTQATTTVQTQVVASGVALTQNGRLWCELLAAAPKRMSVASSTSFYNFLHTTGGTVYHICKVNNTAASKAIWGTHTAQSWAVAGASAFFNASENPTFLTTRIDTAGSPATGNTINVGHGGLVVGTHLGSYLLDPDNGTAANRHSLWVDTVLQNANLNASTGTPFVENASGDFQLGSLPGSNALPFDGCVGELVIWSGDRTSNRSTWETPARQFWGTP